MSDNVGLPTPRGSGTSGYVQRNLSRLKPRDSGYGSTPSYGPPGSDAGKDTFKQRQPDRQILEHDRRRQIEVRVLEERERLEEENEKIDEEGNEDEQSDKFDEKVEKEKKKKRVKLSEEEIEERLEALRARLTKELEDELAGRPAIPTGPRDKRKQDSYEDKDIGPKGRKQFKTYQVHELAEAKIQESERLRRALGIRNEGEDDFERDDRRRYNSAGERYHRDDRYGGKDKTYKDRDDRYRDRGENYRDKDERYRDRDERYGSRDRKYRDRDDPGDRDSIEEYRKRY
ncbi:hypothetical protein VTO42DRAFT_220 [Malbranchea cinnamomea]